MRRIVNLYSILLGSAVLLSIVGCSDGSDNRQQSPIERLPIIFVHGQSGSAQQFETQAMRFTSNDYPQELLFAFEYDTSKDDNPLPALSSFVDEVLAQTNAEKVQAIGHSRGTSVWISYLEDQSFGGDQKVAKYVNIEGRSPEELPGGIPAIGIWGEWNTANSGYNRREDNSNAQIGPNPEDNYYFPDKSHTETATSAEAFAIMYEFLTDEEAATTDVLPANSDTVGVAGRTTFFPENTGYAGSTLQVWEIIPASGQRSGDSPLYTVKIDESGNFGPLQFERERHYEFALLRKATETFPLESVHHFYTEPFTHDDYFVRLQTSLPGESISAFLPKDEDASGLVLVRQKELWGDQGAMSDELFIDGLNVLLPNISPRINVNLAFFAYDEDSDKVTDLEKGELFPFNLLTFLTAADVFIPSTFAGNGTMEIVLVTRGRGQTSINVPSWPSSTHRISVIFRDDIP